MSDQPPVDTDPTDALRERQKKMWNRWPLLVAEQRHTIVHDLHTVLDDLTQALGLLDGCHKKQQKVYEAFERAHEQELALRQELTKAQERIEQTKGLADQINCVRVQNDIARNGSARVGTCWWDARAERLLLELPADACAPCKLRHFLAALDQTQTQEQA